MTSAKRPEENIRSYCAALHCAAVTACLAISTRRGRSAGTALRIFMLLRFIGQDNLHAMRANSAQWNCGHSGLGGLSGRKAHRLSPLVSPVDSATSGKIALIKLHLTLHVT